MASEKSILRSMLRGGAGSNVELPTWFKRFGPAVAAIPQAYDKAKMYSGNKLDDTYTALTNLLKVADTEEGMKLYNRKLDEFASDSLKFGGFDDNIVQADTLKLLGEQKNTMRRNFDTAIQDSSDFIGTDEFLDKADEFVNIQDTMDAKKIKGSVADFLQSELANANSLYDNMVGGFQIQGDQVVGTNFRYNKAEINDKETFRKLELYRDRLDLAVKSLAGNGKISTEEAKAIIIGDSTHYFATKDAALRKAEKNYISNKSMVVKYDGLINSAKQKKLSADDIFAMEGLDDASKLEMGGNLTAGSWDKIEQQLINEKAEYKRLRNEANENYKNWYGSYFESLEGGLSLGDIEGFDFTKEIKSKEDVKKAAKASLGITFPEKDVTTEQISETKKQKRRIKGVLPEEEVEDKELYSSSEKILEDYIAGKVDADSLREIGGQSLVSDADRIKSAAKGQKPKYTVIPGVKTRERAPIDVDTLKTLNFTSKAGKYSWHDVVNKIYGKKERGLSVVDDYLSGDVGIKNFKLTYRTRRDRAENIKKKFKNLNISLEEFKKQYSKDYETLINLLGKSRAK